MGFPPCHLSRSEGRVREILGRIAPARKEEYSEEEKRELMRVLNNEIIRESEGGFNMESESDKTLGGISTGSLDMANFVHTFSGSDFV